jgi:hypothetical protein
MSQVVARRNVASAALWTDSRAERQKSPLQLGPPFISSNRGNRAFSQRSLRTADLVHAFARQLD